MEKESSQEELKEKSESGKLPSKLKLWKFPSKNIEAECGQFKSAEIIALPSQQVVMVPAFYGTSRNIPECSVCSRRQLLSKLFLIPKNIKS